MTICTRPLLWLVTAAVCVRAGNIVGDEPEDTALDACGLPRGYWQTSHCFRDSTHHTCCLLGPEARRYSDASGNPIGTASSKAFRAKHGVAPTDEDLTPWCTCFGSLVCSYYAERFNDGTHIKFIYEPGSNPPLGAFGIPANKNCEAKARDAFKVQAHGTPGVTDSNGAASKCSEYTVSDHLKPISQALQEGLHKVPGVSGAPATRAAARGQDGQCIGASCARTRGREQGSTTPSSLGTARPL